MNDTYKTDLSNEEILNGDEDYSRRTDSRLLTVIFLVLSIIGIGASVFHLFSFNIGGHLMWPRAYYSLLIACFMPIVFLSIPHRTGGKLARWFDYAIATLILSAGMYIFFNAENIEFGGWEYVTPLTSLVVAVPITLIILEGARRSAGLIFFFVCLFFTVFPLFTEYLPGILHGIGFTLSEVIAYYIYSTEALFGIPMRVMGDLLIGFLVFAVALQSTGGGKFFLDLSFAMVGGSRGGPAKVAVVASGFFGSMSGSAIANVTTTGAITIPAMKKLGYPAHYAGAVEACASTGGVLMPPIMGATVFIMAEILGVSYTDIVIAAFIPAILYYLSLILQVDAYAARNRLTGLAKENIPSFLQTLKGGWPYLISLGFLLFALFYLRVVALAPYYATALLLLTTLFRKKTRFSLSQWVDYITHAGKTIALIMATLLGVGFIIGSLMVTGVALSFSYEVILLAGGSAALLLILGAGVSFVLGMGLTISACYILLALTMAPPLITAGFDPMAVHLFVLYYGMLSFITPPVALSAFAASGIAGSSPVKTGITAMRLGAILYVVPFVFVIEPSLIFHGSILEMLHHFITFVLGIFFVTAASEGYLLGYGNMERFFSVRRILVLITGVLLIIPQSVTTITGLILALIIMWPAIKNRISRKQPLDEKVPV